MPQESLGFVRMIWICPNCASKNPGNFRFCRGCGAAQPPDIQFQPDDQDQMVTDAKELEQARQGPDAHCGFCGARNPASAKTCQSCGADMATGTRRESGAVISAFRTGPAADVICPACGTANPPNSLTCKSCGAALPAALRPPSTPTAPAKNMPRWLIFVIGGLVLLCIILAVSFFTRTSSTTATVARQNWERSIAILALQPVQHQNWKSQLPTGASVNSCETRLNRTSDQPTDNSKKVCGTPYTVDKGNGYSEVVQDCQYEIYEDYCTYTVQDWTVINTAVQRGSDSNPIWPQVNLASDQRAGQQQELYHIVFSTPDGEKTYTTSDAAEYEQARPGTNWMLTINAFGDISAIQPAR